MQVVLSFCMSPPISRWNEPRHGSTHIPRLHQSTVHSARFSNPPPRRPPSPRFRARHRFLYTHFLTKKLRRTRTGSSLRKGSTRPSHGPPSRARPALSRGAQRRPSPGRKPWPQRAHFLEPWPSDLASTATASGGMMSASSPLLDSSFWPPSGPEPSERLPSPWRGLGRPRRAAAAA